MPFFFSTTYQDLCTKLRRNPIKWKRVPWNYGYSSIYSLFFSIYISKGSCMCMQKKNWAVWAQYPSETVKDIGIKLAPVYWYGAVSSCYLHFATHLLCLPISVCGPILEFSNRRITTWNCNNILKAEEGQTFVICGCFGEIAEEKKSRKTLNLVLILL